MNFLLNFYVTWGNVFEIIACDFWFAMTDGTFICRDAIPCLPEERFSMDHWMLNVTIQSCNGFVHLYMIVGKINRWTKRSWLGHSSIHSAACDVSTFSVPLHGDTRATVSVSGSAARCRSLLFIGKTVNMQGQSFCSLSHTPFPQIPAEPLPSCCTFLPSFCFWFLMSVYLKLCCFRP